MEIAQSKDLSMSGILFSNKTSFEIGAKLQIQIPIADFKETIVVIGTVVRTEYYGPQQFDIGVSFLEMDTNTRSELSKLLTHVSS